jgi:hypothetical protein
MVGARRGLKFETQSTDMGVLRKELEALPQAEIIALCLSFPELAE